MAEADLTPEQRATAELLARYNDEIRRFGSASPETRAAMMAGGEKTAKRLDFYAQSASAALGGLASGAGSVAKAMYSGETGMKQFNGMIDGIGQAAGEASKALLVAGGPIGKVAAVVLKFVELLTGPAKAVNELADKYYTSYQQLARSGAAASDGMMGVGNDALKMGLVLKDMDGYVQLISSNAPELARFGGSAAEGRRMLANMGQELEKDRANFMALGMDMKDVGEGMAGFVKQQNLSGGVSTRNTKELAQSARAYILEQDAITKLTGVSRKDMEEQHASAMREEQYNALLRKVRREQGDEAADAIINTRKMIENTVGPQAAKGFAASMTGNLSDPEARRFVLTAGADTVNALQNLKTGLMDPIQAVGLVGKGLKRFEGGVGNSLGLIGANNSTFLAYHELVKAGMIDESKLRDDYEKLKKLQADAVKNGDKETAQQAKLRAEQLDIAITAQKGMQLMVAPMQASALKLTEIIGDLVDGLTTLVNWFFKKPTPRPVDAKTQKLQKYEDELAKMIDAAKQPGSKITKEDIRKKELEIGKMAVEARKSQAEEHKLRQDVKRKENALKLRGNKASEQEIQEVEILKQRLKDLEENNKKSSAAPAASAAAPKESTGAAGGAGGTAAGVQPPSEPAGAGTAAAKAPAPAQTTGAEPPASTAPSGPGVSGQQTQPIQLAQVSSKSGAAGQVNQEYSSKFQSLIDWLDNKKYHIYNIGGYVDRDVRGKPGVKSVHARGAAIDINPKENPMGSQLITDMPEDVATYASSLGLGWGGNWTSSKDAMHFSIAKHEGGSIPLMADGGITHGPAVVGEAGPEAVIPLKSGSVPVDLGTLGESLKQIKPLSNSEKITKNQDNDMTQVVEKAIRALAAQLSKPKPIQVEMLEMLRDIKRANDDTADISAKIARTAMN